MNKVEFHEFVIVIEDVWKVNNFINCNQQLDEDARGTHHELIIAIEKKSKIVSNVTNGNQQILWITDSIEHYVLQSGLSNVLPLFCNVRKTSYT